jgi:thermostable 8-oxoguanine DNA glycosylase
MQAVWAGHGAAARLIELPPRQCEVIEGVRWGSPDQPGTPAYWAVRCQWGDESTPNFSGGASSLIEEIGFCLLGGYSVTFEANVAAFNWLRKHGAFDLQNDMDEDGVLELLSHMRDDRGRLRRYRFPNQRSGRIAALRRRMMEKPLNLRSARDLRDDLMTFDGIGPKTASWIVRNHLASDEVAIIDIHVLRACRNMSLFPEAVSLPKDYFVLEQRFLDFAKAINVRSSVLDAVIWAEMRVATR